MRPASAVLLLLGVVGVASQQPIIIDDSFEYSTQDPTGIQYFGRDWLTNNTNYNHRRYNQTSHAAKPLGSGFVFSFRGSSIAWYADKSRYVGSMTLQLDGISTMVTNIAPSITFQQELWRSSTLDGGDHQLVVTNTGGTLIGVDSLSIMPNDGTNDIRPTGLGPGASSVPPGAVLVDDSDPSISYSGSGWQTRTGAYMQNTSQYTTSPGDSCRFTFQGSQFWYFGNDVSQNAVVDISIDGNKLYSGASDTSGFVQKLIWASPQLNSGRHTVTIAHAGNSGDTATVEFFMYMPSPGSSKSVPLGAIVGASVGGAVLLTLIGGLLVIWGNRRKKNRENKTSEAPEPVYEPFPAKEAVETPGADHSTLNYRGSMLDSSSGYQSPAPTGGALSGKTNFTASGYHGHPEVQM